MRFKLKMLLSTVSVAAAVWLATTTAVTAHTASSHQVPLAEPRSSTTGPDQFVVSFAVGGELHGLLTLTLDRSGTTASGEWALVTSSDPEAEAEHEHEHVEEPSGEPHVDLGPTTFTGTLAGTISSAELVFDDQGTLVAIDSAALEVVSGSVLYEGATGSGSAEATSIDPAGAAAAQGLLSLDLSLPGGH